MGKVSVFPALGRDDYVDTMKIAAEKKAIETPYDGEVSALLKGPGRSSTLITNGCTAKLFSGSVHGLPISMCALFRKSSSLKILRLRDLKV